MTAAQILQALVAIATPSSVSNVPLLRWVVEFLDRIGWRSEILPYSDDAGVPKANLIAWPRISERPERFDLAFVCHTDTVPFAAGWDGALRLEERDGNLHGCGSCDVKGALACFLAAVAQVCESHPGDKDKDVPRMEHPDLFGADLFGSVGLILTADEEIGCRGMERLLSSIELRIGSAIVSEPTTLSAGIAGKGYGLARVTVTGKEAHSAFPAKGVSAISLAARLIAGIEDRFALEYAGKTSDSLFDPPRTTLNIGVIEGGTAKNIIPGRCSFLVEWRGIPADVPAGMLEFLERLVAEVREAEPRVAIQLERLRAEPGFSPADEGPLQSRLAELLGTKPIGISFGSEASRLARLAGEVIVIGPGDMRTAHSDRECVPIAELERWTAILKDLIRGK
jgi:acetylornithine deacetylase